MRPPSVYANPACTADPAGCPCDVARLLHGRHRVGARLVMVLLSQRGWTAVAIAELLGCDPATVRRWIHRYNAHGAIGLGGYIYEKRRQMLTSIDATSFRPGVVLMSSDATLWYPVEDAVSDAPPRVRVRGPAL